jgi:hypothetical protein
MGINQQSSGEPQSETTIKKPYEKPTFRYEHVFVTSALSCGKVSPTQATCTSLSAS